MTRMGADELGRKVAAATVARRLDPDELPSFDPIDLPHRLGATPLDAEPATDAAGLTPEPAASVGDGWDLDNPFGGDPDYLPDIPEPTLRELEEAGVMGRVAALDSRVRAGRLDFSRAGADLARAAYSLHLAARLVRPFHVAAELDYAAEGLAHMATSGDGVEPGALIGLANRCRRIARELVASDAIATPVDLDGPSRKAVALAGVCEAAVEDTVAHLAAREAIVRGVL